MEVRVEEEVAIRQAEEGTEEEVTRQVEGVMEEEDMEAGMVVDMEEEEERNKSTHNNNKHQEESETTLKWDRNQPLSPFPSLFTLSLFIVTFLSFVFLFLSFSM